MSVQDKALLLGNTLVFSISFANIENTMKLVLLSLSIIFTSYKIYDLHQKRKNNGSNNTSED